MKEQYQYQGKWEIMQVWSRMLSNLTHVYLYAGQECDLAIFWT